MFVGFVQIVVDPSNTYRG